MFTLLNDRSIIAVMLRFGWFARICNLFYLLLVLSTSKMFALEGQIYGIVETVDRSPVAHVEVVALGASSDLTN